MLTFPSDEIYKYINGAQHSTIIDSVKVVTAFPNINADTIFESLEELEEDKLIKRVPYGAKYKYVIVLKCENCIWFQSGKKCITCNDMSNYEIPVEL